MKLQRGGIVTIALMLLVIVAIATYIVFFIDESEVQKRDNTPAAQALLVENPENSFTDLGGTPVSTTDYFGKIIIVTSWASWCPQCTDSLRDLGTIAQEYKERDVVVLAINRAENRYTAERFLSTISVAPELTIVLDPSDHYFGASTGYAMPETIVYTKDGEVNLHQRGNVQLDEIRAHLDELQK